LRLNVFGCALIGQLGKLRTLAELWQDLIFYRQMNQKTFSSNVGIEAEPQLDQL
jgi:hypothetical protein